MKTEKEVKERLKQLKQEKLKFISREHNFPKAKLDAKIKILEWVLE